MEGASRTTDTYIGKFSSSHPSSDLSHNLPSTTPSSTMMNAPINNPTPPEGSKTPNSHNETRVKIPREQETRAKTMLDRQNRAIAALAFRFKNLVDLTASPPAEGAMKEVAAAEAFRMEVESAALVCYPSPITSPSQRGSKRLSNISGSCRGGSPPVDT